jgi:hypothetical protein
MGREAGRSIRLLDRVLVATIKEEKVKRQGPENTKIVATGRKLSD